MNYLTSNSNETAEPLVVVSSREDDITEGGGSSQNSRSLFNTIVDSRIPSHPQIMYSISGGPHHHDLLTTSHGGSDGGDSHPGETTHHVISLDQFVTTPTQRLISVNNNLIKITGQNSSSSFIVSDRSILTGTPGSASSIHLESLAQQHNSANAAGGNFKSDKNGSGGEQGNQGDGEDVCVVCGDRSSGRHYGARSCEGCKGFFKRSIRKSLVYACRGQRTCSIDKTHRNRCQYCRLQKCLFMGMKSESVQCERSPMTKHTSNSEIILTGDGINGGKLKHRDSEFVINGKMSQRCHLNTLASVVANVQSLSRNHQLNAVLNSNPAPTSGFARSATVASGYDGGGRSKMHHKYQTAARTTAGSCGGNHHKKSADDVAKALEGLNETLKQCSATTHHSYLRVSPTSSTSSSFEGPLLTEANFAFDFSFPSTTRNDDDATSKFIGEYASQLLMTTCQWVGSIAPFQIIGSDGNLSLLRDCWHELFILGLLQSSSVVCLDKLLENAVRHLTTAFNEDDMEADRLNQLNHQVKVLHYLILRSRDLNISSKEFAYLKSAILFCPDFVDFENRLKIQRFQTQIVNELSQEIGNKRISDLLLLLPSVRTLTPKMVEDLFFPELIGNVKINSIFPHILELASTTGGGGSSTSTGDHDSGGNIIFNQVNGHHDDEDEEDEDHHHHHHHHPFTIIDSRKSDDESGFISSSSAK